MVGKRKKTKNQVKDVRKRDLVIQGQCQTMKKTIFVDKKLKFAQI